MNCKIARLKMIDYIDEALYRSEREEMNDHFCVCPDCRETWQNMKAFSDTCAEFVVYPDKPYSFNTLRARMATIRPLDEVVAFLPKMRATGLTARLATALLLLAFVAVLPATMRSSREAYVALRRPFTEGELKWNEEYQQELDRQYRRQMAAHHSPAWRDSANDAG